jgi:hypothetical protein
MRRITCGSCASGTRERERLAYAGRNGRRLMSLSPTADRVREGLTRLVADAAWWPTSHPAAFRNRLLDEGGGDSRPYVELVWRLHELRVAERLQQGTDAPLVRCRTVTRAIVAETLLDRDATQWGVESWAVALGVVDAAALAPVHAMGSAPLPSAPGVRLGSGRAPGVATPASPPGTRVAPTAAAPKRRWTIGTPGTPRSPLPKGPSPAAVVGLVAVIAGLFAVMLLGGRLLRPRRAVAPAVVDVAASDDTAAGASTPPALSAAAPQAQSRDTAVPLTVPTGMVAALSLRDGRTLRGVVDLVTPSDVFLHEAESGLPYGMPLVFVRALRALDGRVLWSAPDSALTTAAAAAVPVDLRARGVGGDYRVIVRSASVDGDAACKAEPQWQVGRSWIERVDHHAPDDSASMPERRGVTIRLAADGRFAAGPTTGVQHATQWWFAMRGRFAPAGFTATTDLRTATTLKWRKVQRCQVRADLAAVRVR